MTHPLICTMVIERLQDSDRFLSALYDGTKDQTFDTARHFVRMAIDELERAKDKTKDAVRK